MQKVTNLLKKIGHSLNHNKKKIAIGFLIAVFVLVTGSIVTVGTLYSIGKHSINNTKKMVVEGANLDGDDLNQAVLFDGEEYAYKKGIVNILILGVDNEYKMSDTVLPGDLGQSDSIYLMSLDTYNHKVSIMGIPRDTMVPIQIMQSDNDYYNIQTLQITLQYAYGDNCVSGSKLTARAVSTLLYNVPIERVCVVNLDTVQLLNDAIGGVTVEIQDDFTDESGEIVDEAFYKGNVVTLMGDQALLFVRERDCSLFASSMTRIARQEQYMSAFLNKAKEALSNDKYLALDIYQQIVESDYVYTDISKLESAYLLAEGLKMTFSSDDITTAAGEVTTGEKFEEYYVDSDALKQQVIDMFYQKLN